MKNYETNISARRENDQSTVTNNLKTVKNNNTVKDSIFVFERLHLDDECLILQRALQLTSTQVVVLRLVASGKLNKQIAFLCGISTSTVKTHVSTIMKRLRVRTRTEAAVFYALLSERIYFSQLIKKDG